MKGGRQSAAASRQGSEAPKQQISKIGIDVTELLAKAEVFCGLSDWDDRFIDNLRDRVLQFGDQVWLSEKQIEQIRRIATKIGAA